MVHSQSVALCISVREQTSLQHTVGRETDTRHHIGRIERCLLYICKVVFRIAVQFHHAHFNQRIFFLRPYFGQVERIERTVLGLLFRHYLNVHGPFGEVAFLNAFIQIALVAFTVFGNDGFCFCIGQVLDALLRMQVEFHPSAFSFCVDK